MDLRPHQSIQRRLQVGRGAAWTMMGILASFYGYIQVIRHRDLVEQAEIQAVKNLAIPAPRGRVFDRNGQKLVDNVLARDLVIQKEDLPKDLAALEPVAQALGLDAEDLKRKARALKTGAGTRALVLKHNLDETELAKAELIRARNPFLGIELAPRRVYFGQDLAGHLVGYVGEVSTQELESDPKRFLPGEIIGKSGLERSHNEDLKGVDGVRRVYVNNLNHPVAVQSTQPPRLGTSVALTLDAGLQQVLYDALQGQRGAAVVLDLRDGGVLGMVSTPGIDPNMFLNKLSQEQVSETFQHPDHPMENRALRGRFPPGSTFKLLMALAALEAGKVTPTEVINCPGRFHFGNRDFKCEHVHGGVNLVSAIAQSCNTYFYTLGARLDIDDIYASAKKYGLVGPTGIDLPDEKGSRVPSREWKARIGKTKADKMWMPGETISVAIGQGNVGLTPLGLARFYAVLATRGRLFTPHIVLGTVDEQTGQVKPAQPPESKNLNLDPQIQAVLEEGLYQVVANGTAHACRIPGLDMVGKTGTAQVRGQTTKSAYASFDKKHKDHAWFAGYAPRQNPQIAFAVIVENAGFGASSAAPVAKRACEYWFLQRATQPVPPPVRGRRNLFPPVLGAPPAEKGTPAGTPPPALPGGPRPPAALPPAAPKVQEGPRP